MTSNGGWRRDEYESALRALAAAVEREGRLVAEASETATVDTTMSEARSNLERVGATGMMRPLTPRVPNEKSDRLQKVRRASEHQVVALGHAIADEVTRVEADRAADRRRNDLHQDLAWRIPVPVAVGLVIAGVLGQAIPAAFAVIVAAGVATLITSLDGAYLFKRLLPAPARHGLTDQDAALVWGGAYCLLFGLVVLPFAAPPINAVGAMVVAGFGAYIAVKRFNVWRATQA